MRHRWLLWLMLWMQLVVFMGVVLGVSLPLAQRSATDVAGLMLMAAKTWEELPDNRRQAFANSLQEDTGVMIERGVLADIPTSFRPHWYGKWVAEALTEKSDYGFEVQMQNEWVEVWFLIDDTPIVLRSPSPKLGKLLIVFLALTSLSVMGTLIALLWQKRWQEQQLRNQVMLSGLSHDLRTPLTRLQLQLSLLPNTSEAHQRKLTQQIQLMSDMVEMALLLSKKTGHLLFVEQRLVPLTVLWEEWKSDYPNVHFSPFEDQPIEVSRFLRRMGQNLIDNALAHGEGEVWVSASIQENRVLLEVADEGYGIPDRVWRFLQRSELPPAKGHGLGLLSTLWLAELLSIDITRIKGGVRLGFGRAKGSDSLR